MIEQNKLYTFTQDASVIPDEAFVEARKLVYDKRDLAIHSFAYTWSLQSFMDTEDNNPWRKWAVFNGDYRGTWPKRFAQYLYKNHKTKADPKLIADIGEIIKRYEFQPLEYALDFVRPTWTVGNYADGDSCWYQRGERGYKMYQMHKASPKGLAIRFFKNKQAYLENPDEGIGRAWAWLDDGILYAFNQRGQHGRKWQEIVSKATGMPFIPCNVDVNIGYTDGGGYAFGAGARTNYTIMYNPKEVADDCDAD